VGDFTRAGDVPHEVRIAPELADIFREKTTGTLVHVCDVLPMDVPAAQVTKVVIEWPAGSRERVPIADFWRRFQFRKRAPR
jgi:hypothetical protein